MMHLFVFYIFSQSIARYKTAQMLLHGLCLQAKTDADRDQLLKCKYTVVVIIYIQFPQTGHAGFI